jgi:hypothetical protein
MYAYVNVENDFALQSSVHLQGHPIFQVRQESRPFSLGGDFSLGSFPFPGDSWMGITNSQHADEVPPIGDRPFAALFPR